MDPIQNPFSPGAGTPPPELVGRSQILSRADILLKRMKQGRPEKGILLTGLRGVGKTVLLNRINHLAQETGYHTMFIEAPEERSLVALLTPQLRHLLLELSMGTGTVKRARRALAVLKAFVSTVRVRYGEIELGMDVDPERGTADSGNLETDLSDLFTAVGEAAHEGHSAVALFVDEMQYLEEAELQALIMAMHRLQQQALPFTMVGAGLPTLRGKAGKAKSYAERLFDFTPIGELPSTEAARAIRDPVKGAGADIERAALEEICRLTQGYPYFLQEWGYQSWNRAAQSPIRLQDVQSATTVVIQRLDEGFFHVRFDRLTPSERRFLAAMAQLGAGPHQTGDVAAALRIKVTSLGPVRASLINKGMIYGPEHGRLAFTVPLFDEFMKRTMPSGP